MFGPNWADQVDTICAEYGIDSDVCTEWTATVGAGIPEMSVQQGEQLWQQAFSQEFNQYSSSFVTDGWLVDGATIPLAAINVLVNNAYVTYDALCDVNFNTRLLNTIPTQDFYTTFIRDEIDNFNIGISNSNEHLMNYILTNLEISNGQVIEMCDTVDLFNWTEPTVAP